MVKTKPFALLSGNVLKLLGAIFMVIDHIGVIFFPFDPGDPYGISLWRYVGRVSMPFFAYLIAEGCRYTRNPWLYLGKLAACLGVCQVGYFVGEGSLEICILGTFFIGASLLFCLQEAKKAIFQGNTGKTVLFLALLLAGIGATYYVNQRYYIDYGFWGCMLPLSAGIFYLPEAAPGRLKKWDNKWTSLLCFALCLVIASYDNFFPIQGYCLLSLPVLALYSGKRGKWKLTWFFYLFYPLHLALLYGLYFLHTL